MGSVNACEQSYSRHVGGLQHTHQNFRIICTRPGLLAHPSSCTSRRAGGQQGSTARTFTSQGNKQESLHLDANLSFLKPNSYSPWEVQVTTILVGFSMSHLRTLKNLFGCQNHGSPSTHSKVRICLFCKREPRKRHVKEATSSLGKKCLWKESSYLSSYVPGREEDHRLSS